MSTDENPLSSQSYSSESSQLFVENKNTFIKSDPTPVQKYRNQDYGTLDQELEVMQAMNQVVPDYVPDIIDYEEEDGDITEIEYEFVDGGTVGEISTGSTEGDWSITRDDFEELEELISSLHENEIVHGDLNRNNVIYGSEGWSLLDPAGVMKDDPDYEAAKRDDTQRLSRMEGLLDRSRHQNHF